MENLLVVKYLEKPQVIMEKDLEVEKVKVVKVKKVVVRKVNHLLLKLLKPRNL
jgi:hypothetical protein